MLNDTFLDERVKIRVYQHLSWCLNDYYMTKLVESSSLTPNTADKNRRSIRQFASCKNTLILLFDNGRAGPPGTLSTVPGGTFSVLRARRNRKFTRLMEEGDAPRNFVTNVFGYTTVWLHLHGSSTEYRKRDNTI